MKWTHYEPKFEYEKALNDVGLHWTGHKNFAYELVRNSKPLVIVELGTWRGTSLCSFLQGVKDENCGTRVFAVDTWQGDLHMGKFNDNVFRDVNNLVKTYYGELECFLMKMSFDDAVSQFKDKTINILHIDGLHTYEGVKHDYETWINKVADDGVILFHDIFINKEDFGVFKFWEELKKEHKTIEFHHSYGLGVLFKDSNKCDDLIPLEKEWQMRYSYMAEDKKNKEINFTLDALEKVNNLIEDKNKEIENKNKEVNFMKSSKFWKIRDWYLRRIRKSQ